MKNNSYSLHILFVNTIAFSIFCFFIVVNIPPTNANPTYCIPQPSNYACQQMYLGKVKTSMALINFSDTIHPCPLSSYTDHSTTKFVTQHAGGIITIFGISTEPMDYNVYVDWNNNGLFSDTGELVVQFGSFAAGWDSGTFVVPALQPAGTYRLRIRGEDQPTGYPTGPCSQLNYGNTIDYSLIVGEATGLDEVVFNSGVEVYPNPFTTEVALNFPNTTAQIKIFDLTGNLLLSTGSNRDGINQSLIRLAIDLPKGVYILNLAFDDGSDFVNKKLIKM